MNRKFLAALSLSLCTAVPAFSSPHHQKAPLDFTYKSEIHLAVAGTYSSGLFDEGAAEIAAYDRSSRRLFVTNASANSVDVLNIRNIRKPRLKFTIDLSPYGGGVNSVAVKDGIVALAVEAEVKQDPGSVVFFDVYGNYLSEVEAGALPDMVTFTPDGLKVLVANEGEPDDAYTNDPLGTVSIIDLSAGIANLTQDDVTTVDFTGFDGEDVSPVRIFGPGASVSQDLEPEYIAVSEDSSTAWVTLQENNAIATIDLENGLVTSLTGLGVKNHNSITNGLDASDKDDEIAIKAWPVVGMFQPDSIARFTVDDQEYLVIANEGDARDYDGFSEEARVKDEGDDFIVDEEAYPDIEELKENENIGRLKITTATGDTDGDGDIDILHAYGARSFSILNSEGEMIYDSGSEFERIIAEVNPENFNSGNDENDSFDSRSDDKGPEPEGLTTGTVYGRTYAFIGLERDGGIMVYDISTPASPHFVQYISNRNFDGDPEAGTAGDLGPEGLLFISAADSPNRQPLLVVTNEISGTTTIYRILKVHGKKRH